MFDSPEESDAVFREEDVLLPKKLRKWLSEGYSTFVNIPALRRLRHCRCRASPDGAAPYSCQAVCCSSRDPGGVLFLALLRRGCPRRAPSRDLPQLALPGDRVGDATAAAACIAAGAPAQVALQDGPKAAAVLDFCADTHDRSGAGHN